MKKQTIRDYSKDKESLKKFLEEHNKYDNDGNKVFKYREQLTQIAHRERVPLIIDLADVYEHDDQLAIAIKHNTRRYVNILLELVQEMLPNFKERAVAAKDALDVYIEHRLLMEQRNQFAGEQRDPRNKYAPELMRRFEVYFKNASLDDSEKEAEIYSVRDLKASHLGHLVTVKGIVTKSTEVKPLLTVATYTCDQCGSETYQTINSLNFMPLQTCVSEDCKLNKKGGRLYIQTKGSKFIKFQEIKLQEHSDQVPVGHIPRALTVYCRGETTRQCQPGDHINLTGILLPMVQSGPHAARSAPLLNETFVDAHEIICLSNANSGDDSNNEFTDEQLEILRQDDLYSKLAKSIAPEIYGMENVKKALLLLLVGAADNAKGDIKIRGSINICLMGDPGVAKSQLLSFITRLSPRSQFTTGRGSSGVGLTAAVVKDPLTGQMMLEGGALVLADQGVCCIDEFDKMSESDRTAIHEVMEQQTISIAKAGIMTRLNARVSILAAANPVYGRYNPKRTIEQNIALPAALLSRFDLLWLLRDKADRANDLKLAKHITHVHRHYNEPQTVVDAIDMSLMKKYINLCKKKSPVIPEILGDSIVESYVKMRQESRNNPDKTFTSARNLLAALRLAIALARLRLSDVVDKDDIAEANRLIKMSKDSINSTEFEGINQTSESKLLSLVRDVAGNKKTVKISDILDCCISKGLQQAVVMDFLDQYEENNVWLINQSKTVLTFL